MANNKVYSDYLMHGRTKGSKNGISTTKGYTAVGQKAKGRWINGRYVYPQTVYPKAGVVTGPRPKYQSPMDYARSEGYARYEAHKAANNKKLTFDTPKSYGGNVENTQSGSVSKPSSLHISPRGHYVNGHYVYYEDEAKQRAFRQGLAESRGRNSAYENQAMVKRMENSRKADALDQKMYGKKVKGYTRLADISPYEKQRLANKYLSNSPQHQAAVNQHNAEVSGREDALTYSQKKRKRTNIGASQAADAARTNAETRNRILSSSKGSSEKGASNNWQQQANKASSGNSSGYNNSHYSAVSQAAAERKAREAALKQQKKASLLNAAAKGANNNWQQRANKESGKGLAYDKTTTHGSYINARGERAYTTDKPKKWEDEREARWKSTDAAKAESQLRNSRSDIGNAFADLKEDAKNTFKALKSKFKKKKK